MIQALTDFELADLKAKVAECERRREQDQAEIQQRDAKMQQLVAELRTLVKSRYFMIFFFFKCTCI